MQLGKYNVPRPQSHSTTHTADIPLQQNYVDYHKCVNAKGEEFAPCQQFKRAYRSLCPSESSLVILITKRA